MKALLLLVVALFAALTWAYDCGFRLNVTPSLDRGIYRISENPPQRGDIVAFCLSGPSADLARERGYLQPGSCPSGLRPLMKRLAGVPGDVVSVVAEGIVCGPAEGLRCFWPVHALMLDSQGRALAPAWLEGTIPSGQALVLTPHHGGYDSRYFGFVPLPNLTTYTPVCTF